MAVSITFNEAALRSIAIAGAAGDLRQRANRVLNAARRNAPVDTGRLRASIAVEFVQEGDTAVARVGSNLEYAIYVHEGTGIYGPSGSPITPKSGQFLVWPMVNNAYKSTGGSRRYKAGKTQTHVFARSVKGIKGRPFLLDALDAAAY